MDAFSVLLCIVSWILIIRMILKETYTNNSYSKYEYQH